MTMAEMEAHTDRAADAATVPDSDPLGTHSADLGGTTTLKAGALFLVTQTSGEVPAQSAHTGRHGLGLYFHDTRFVNEKRMHVNGRPMTLLFESADLGDRCTRELTNPELPVPGGGGTIHKETLGLHVETTLNGEVREVLTFRNFSREALETTLTLAYGSDFDDIFTVRGMQPGVRGHLDGPYAENGVLRLGYTGADHRRRTTEITFDPPPDSIGGTCATFHMILDPGGARRLEVVFRLADRPMRGADDGLEVSPDPTANQAAQVSDLLGLPSSTVRMTSSNELFNRVMRRSFLDLAMLETRQGGDVFFAAGVPWYVALFGRDSIITALETLAFAPEVGRATLRVLARHQGRERNPERDEEPGKILHELRVGELAQLREVPFTPYYGTVDATPLFLVLLGEYLQWTGDLECFATLRPQVDAALDWLERCGDPDGDGLFEYVSRASDGLVNQGWKDSYNAIVDADGSLARPPIALVEMQGYVFRAFRAVANVYRATGDGERAALLERRATEVQDRFEESFWNPELGNYALALHGDPGSKHARGRRRLQPRPGPVGRHRLEGSRGSGARQHHGPGSAQRRLGGAHAVAGGRGVQPVRLPDWRRLAPRQRDGGRRSALIRLRRGGAGDLHRVVRGGHPVRPLPAPRAVRRLRPRDVWPTRPVSRGVQPSGLGRREPAVPPDLSVGDCPGRLRPHAAHHPAAFTGVARLG